MVHSIGRERTFAALLVLAWFWIWATHVATGFLDALIASRSGLTSAIVGGLDTFTHELLVRPIGKPLAVATLAVTGIGLAVFLHGGRIFHSWRGNRPDDLQRDAESSFGRQRMANIRNSAKAETSTRIREGTADSPPAVALDNVSEDDPKERFEAALADVCTVDSAVLRQYFLSRMEDEDGIAHDILQQRRDAAFSAAFNADPLPLTLDLYTRLLARRRLPYKPNELRRLNAAFDDALSYGWKLSLATHAPSLRLSDDQLATATQTAGKLIASGVNQSMDIFDRWYWHIVRAAAEDSWPKHRDILISMFSIGFTGRSNQHHAVVELTEKLLKETPLGREDIPELVEFDRISAKLDAVRASVLAELGEPLASAMVEVLDSGRGFLDRNKLPALRSLCALSPEQRGDCFTQLVSTITGLDRHGINHWEKLKRKRGRYQLGHDYDPDYLAPPEMSFLFLELAQGEIALPDRDRTMSAFIDLLPCLIYIFDRKVLDLVLDTARQIPKGQTAEKLKGLIGVHMNTGLLKDSWAEIEETLSSLP